MAVNGTRAEGPSSLKMGLSGYKRTPRTRVPSSIPQMINSEKIICELLKEIYGHAYQDIKKLDVFRGASSDIAGHLSDSGRVTVKVETVDGGDHSYHWFVKIMPLHHQNNELVAKFDVFRNEIEFYSKIAPALKAFLKESNVMNEIEFDIPEMLYAQEDENRAIIVLPDLVHEGYKQERDENGNRYLSTEKATLAVESIAKVHATSYALQMKKKIDLEKSHPSIAEAGAFWTNSDMTSRLILMKDVFCDFLKESSQLDAASILERFKSTFESEETLKQLCKQRYLLEDDSIKCLQHGDFHFNNLLFKEVAGQLKVMIVDWQLTYCGRSAGDVSYLLMSSMDPQLRKVEEGRIKQKYFESFKATLSSLGAGCEMKAVFDKDYQMSLPLGFFFSCGNVMQEDKMSHQDKISFAYQICKEAESRNLI